MGKLDGKTTIITGAASGIGRATAMLFAAEGARVAVADWSEEGEGVAAGIRASGIDAIFVKTDVSNPDDVQAMIAAAVGRWGALHVIFNNAGVEGVMGVPTAEASLENWQRVISINLTGVFLGMKYAIPELLRSGGGSIINNASVAGIVGFQGIGAYCASKGGVIQLSKTAALEYATQGIRVNAICPGVIDTPMVQRSIGDSAETAAAFRAMEPVGRFGTPEEVARVALFLASDDSSFCTGAPFVVDGGFVAA